MQEDYKPAYIPCRLCFEQQKKKILTGVPIGYLEQVFPTASGEKRVVLVHCKCHEKYLNDVRSVAQCKRWGINPMYLTYSISSDYVGTKSMYSVRCLEQYVSQFETESPFAHGMLYLFGDNGTQKTSIAKWVGASLIRRNFTVRYLIMNDLTRILMDAERDEEKLAEVKLLLTADCLIIDEAFDKDKVTIYRSGFQIPFLDSFIRKRFESGKGIIFISNVPPEAIEENGYTKSIQDFVTRNLLKSQATLLFEDNYIFNKETFTDGGLFHAKSNG